MQSWSDFDRLEHEHYWYMQEAYEDEFFETREPERIYFAVRWESEECEDSEIIKAESPEEAEDEFWWRVKHGKIKDFPDDATITEIVEVA